uniref:Centriole, cilia and spindle-associated protein b n=1 Tax=Nothobranchius furzeri TaxID=105023 RepID=A0A8C6NNR6_NOTFU
MVTRRVRSEYMKKFKDPKWDTYHKCYEEMLAYRLTRRLLEHTHNPWFWSGSDTDSDSGGHSPPSPSKNRIGTKASREGAEIQLEECEEPRRDIQQMQDQASKWSSPLQQPREDTKESRHPFALYGCGEKDADISDRKTYNVCPAASTSEIHESALRAKTRREVERQIQSQRTEQRRAKSADPSKVRKLVQPEFNPWLTEYMRCFSARTR